MQARGLVGVGGERAQVLQGDAVVLLGGGIGREAIGAVSGEFGEIGDLRGRAASTDQVARDLSGPLGLAPGVVFLQDLRGPPVQAGTPGRRKMFVEIGLEQGMPEGEDHIGALTLFEQHTRLQCLFQQVEHLFFVGGRAPAGHRADHIEQKGVAQDRRPLQNVQAFRRDTRQAHFQHRHDRLR